MAAYINAGSLKVGNNIIYNGKLCRVMTVDWVKPGKGGAYAQLKLRNVIEGNQTDVRLRSDEKVERAVLEQAEMEYLYEDPAGQCFMNTSSFEQVFLDKDLLGDAMDYLLPNTRVNVEYFNERPIGLELPRTVDLVVTETEPVMKTATITSSPKPARLETGKQIMVPQFIETGEKIRVDTVTGEYSERAK
ncbi:MAG: elongation factor P [Nitrospinae bacterium]|nr:elongation factor P [Nitrospinota bacterium]